MYRYEDERELLFTDEGQRMFLTIRDNVNGLLALAGAVTMGRAIFGVHVTGDTWRMMTCVDRMVELGEIVEVTPPNTMGQFRIFTVSPDKAMKG